MKKTWVSILNLVGITASDDSSEKIQLQEEELNAIKAKLEGMTGAEAEKAAALADVAAKTEALAQAQAEHAAAVAAKDARIAELEAEVTALGKKPGAEPTVSKTGAGDDQPDPFGWMSEKTRQAGHNQFANVVLGMN
jgi:hypothetical protein